MSHVNGPFLLFSTLFALLLVMCLVIKLSSERGAIGLLAQPQTPLLSNNSQVTHFLCVFISSWGMDQLDIDAEGAIKSRD